MVAEPRSIPSASHCLMLIRASRPSADPRLQDAAKSLLQYFVTGCSVCSPDCTKCFALAAAAASSSMPMPLALHCFAAPIRNLPTVHREGLEHAGSGRTQQPSALKLTIIAPHIDQGVRAGHLGQLQESLHHILQHTQASNDDIWGTMSSAIPLTSGEAEIGPRDMHAVWQPRHLWSTVLLSFHLTYI